MNIQPSPIRGVQLGTLAFFVLALCSSLAAERKAALPNEGQLLEISTVVIKPEKIAEYERIQKEEVNPALKKAGWTARYFFQGGTLNGAYRFGTARPTEISPNGDILASLSQGSLTPHLWRAPSMEEIEAAETSAARAGTRQ